MPVARGVMSVREGDKNTTQQLVSTFNNLHQLITQSGMIQVADDEYIGQAKTFALTSGVGLTNISSVRTGEGAGAVGAIVAGYKVYRHPSLALYVKVNFESYIARANYAGYTTVSYQVANSLELGGFKKNNESKVFSFNHQDSNILEAVIDFNAYMVTVSCGADHFIISKSDGVKAAINSTNYMSFPYGSIDMIGIAIIASSNDNSKLCIIQPQKVSGVGSVGYYADPVSSSDLSAISYTVFDNTWSDRKNGSAGNIKDPKITSTSEGIRVSQAELVISGSYHRFNFGFVPAVALNNNEVVIINLSGIPQPYLSAASFGSAGHAPTKVSITELSTILLPLDE